MRRLQRFVFLAASLTLLPNHAARAAEWQWSAPILSATSSETQDHPRAFLWIPPNCARIRGVVVGQHNMEEEEILEHPQFRATLEDLGFAEIWITPPLDLFFRFDHGVGAQFDNMLHDLATASGYSELALAPIVPIGHSAAASYPWNFAIWAPSRTLAILSISGQWPYYGDQNTPDFAGRTIDDIPGLVTMGEYEDAWNRAGTGLQQRATHPHLALSMLAEPAGEHFSATDAKVAFLGLYLRKAAQYRLPASWPIDEAPVLKPIDPTRTGWLVDRGRPDGHPSAPAAPIDQYTGNKQDAFWVFDGESARAVEQFDAMYAGKKMQLIGYAQNGQVVPQNPKTHVRVWLKFDPEPDGLTFKLSGTYLDTVPYDWRGLKEGEPIGHPADPSHMVISRICGPVQAVGPDTFSIRFYRMGMDNIKRSAAINFMLRDAGDATYRPMMLESQLNIPLTNTVGQDQQIDFPQPPAPPGVTGLPLSARSTSGLPVYFYVREGPAEINGSLLSFTKIPPRAKFPVPVTIVAWQWGRSIEPKVKSAQPVTRTFWITR